MNIYEYLEKIAKEDGIERFVTGAMIINDNNEVFLAKRQEDDFLGGYYELPGGKMEQDETLYNTLVRETKEETNLEISKVICYIDYKDYISSKGKKTRLFNFAVKVSNPNDVILNEYDEYKWININEIENINDDNIFPNVKRTIMLYKLNKEL